ncbi:hypothetical protein CDV57_09738, partial [Aspergillus fumigatus]
SAAEPSPPLHLIPYHNRNKQRLTTCLYSSPSAPGTHTLTPLAIPALASPPIPSVPNFVNLASCLSLAASTRLPAFHDPLSIETFLPGCALPCPALPALG